MQLLNFHHSTNKEQSNFITNKKEMIRPNSGQQRPSTSKSRRVNHRPATGKPQSATRGVVHTQSVQNPSRFQFPPNAFTILINKGLSCTLSSNSINPAMIQPTDMAFLDRINRQLKIGIPASTIHAQTLDLKQSKFSRTNSHNNNAHTIGAEAASLRSSQKRHQADGWEEDKQSIDSENRVDYPLEHREAWQALRNNKPSIGQTTYGGYAHNHSSIKKVTSTAWASKSAKQHRPNKSDFYLEAGKIKKYGPKKIVRDQSIPRIQKFEFKELNDYLSKYKERLAQRMKNAADRKYGKIWNLQDKKQQAQKQSAVP